MEHLVGQDLEKEAGGRSLGAGEACALILPLWPAPSMKAPSSIGCTANSSHPNVFVTQNRQAELLACRLAGLT